jgi:glycosyltransferase involved in cell wall biosynthesis
VPVVTTNRGSLPEVVGNAAFAVGPDDVQDMAGAIISLILEDNTRSDMQRKAIERAAQFSWEKTARETLMVYDRAERGGV